MPNFRTNLITTAYVSEPILVGNALRLSLQIKDDTATFTWGSAVVELEWSTLVGIEGDVNLENWQSFATAVTFTSSTKGKRNISVAGAGHIRLRTTTADGGADPNAITTYLLEGF